MKRFKKNGLYAVQNFVSYGPIERIIQIHEGFVVIRKSNWIPVKEYFSNFGKIKVVYLEDFYFDHQ